MSEIHSLFVVCISSERTRLKSSVQQKIQHIGQDKHVSNVTLGQQLWLPEILCNDRSFKESPEVLRVLWDSGANGVVVSWDDSKSAASRERQISFVISKQPRGSSGESEDRQGLGAQINTIGTTKATLSLEHWSEVDSICLRVLMVSMVMRQSLVSVMWATIIAVEKWYGHWLAYTFDELCTQWSSASLYDCMMFQGKYGFLCVQVFIL